MNKNIKIKLLRLILNGGIEANITTFLCTHFVIYTNYGNIQLKCTGLNGRENTAPWLLLLYFRINPSNSPLSVQNEKHKKAQLFERQL